MSPFHPLAGPLAPLVLALGLSGCQAIYDDTKGWANRVEASVMKAAKDFGTNNTQAPARSLSGVEWVGEENTSAAATAAPPGLVEQTAAAMAAPKEEAAAGGAGKTPTALDVATPVPPAIKPQTATAVDPTGPVAETNPAAPPMPKLKPVKSADAAPKAAQSGAEHTAASKAPMVIHLSSLRSEKAAKKEWEALKRAFPEQLSAMSPRFARTEIAERGTFYRVLAGPLPSKQAARQVCGALKAKKQYCQVMSAPPSA